MLIREERVLPSWRLWLASIGFWLLICSLSADHSYRAAVRAGRDAQWIQVWLEYAPWWMPWALITPLLIAATQRLAVEGQKYWLILLRIVLLTFATLLLYGVLALPFVALQTQGVLNWQALQASMALWISYSAWHMDFLVFMSVISAGYAWSYFKRAHSEEAHREALQRQLVQLELQSLRSQLNPHFLFNTLNTIAGLIRLDNKNSAIKALTELSAMLRKVLENQSNQMISLAEEMEFIQSYLNIQSMRFGDKLQLQIDVAPQCLVQEVPFMLLQPLVENAVQHGVQQETEQNLLQLHIGCDDGMLQIRLVNRVAEHESHHGFGIGLSNCHERLKRLYSQNYSLELTPLENGYVATELKLPLEATDEIESTDCR
ncbi:MAG: histidine kinase [Gammaproteobacteria bacterium]|nr:histidine kinase [Gammaproteobacteria bacterium]MBU2070906.1 histidine kinase [Gammaproteobacteria bacterium]MBU2183422.1 histidine kinase [Gammaproteobacteria bacterium]MBU2204112.1 histidine kinase [Gammaproteobacteria bacterium]